MAGLGTERGKLILVSFQEILLSFLLSHWPQLSFLVWTTQEKLGKVTFTLSGYVSCWQLASWYENEWETRRWAHSRSNVFYSGSLNLSIDFFWAPVCSAQPSRAFLAKCYLDEQSWLTVTEAALFSPIHSLLIVPGKRLDTLGVLPEVQPPKWAKGQEKSVPL